MGGVLRNVAPKSPASPPGFFAFGPALPYFPVQRFGDTRVRFIVHASIWDIILIVGVIALAITLLIRSRLK